MQIYGHLCGKLSRYVYSDIQYVVCIYKRIHKQVEMTLNRIIAMLKKYRIVGWGGNNFETRKYRSWSTIGWIFEVCIISFLCLLFFSPSEAIFCYKNCFGVKYHSAPESMLHSNHSYASILNTSVELKWTVSLLLLIS